MLLHKQWRQFIFWNKWSGSGLLAAAGTRWKRFLLQTHRGSAHRAGSPPCSQGLGQSQLQRNAATAGKELALLLSWPKSIPSPSPCSGHGSVTPAPRRVSELQIGNKILQDPLTEFLWLNPSDCSPGKVLPLWCNYSVKYGKLFLGMNSAKIWLVGQTL